MLDSQAKATIDQSMRIPDFFSCKACRGDGARQEMRPGHPLADGCGWVYACTILKEEGRCRLDMLREALQSGAVQVHIGIAPMPVIARQEVLALGRGR